MKDFSGSANITVVIEKGTPDILSNVKFFLEEIPQRFLYNQAIDLVSANWDDELPIRFRIDDRSGYDLRFRSASRDAIWISHNTAHPTQQANAQGEVEPRRVDWLTRKTLEIHNFNEHPRQLKYTLRFQRKSDSTQRKNWDPVIINRGGGRIHPLLPPLFFRYVIAGVALALAAVLAFYLFRSF